MGLVLLVLNTWVLILQTYVYVSTVIKLNNASTTW